MNTELPDLPEDKLKEIEAIKQVTVDFVYPDKIGFYSSLVLGVNFHTFNKMIRI